MCCRSADSRLITTSRFTPTVEGSETFALDTFRACGPAGTGLPCQGNAGQRDRRSRGAA